MGASLLALANSIYYDLRSSTFELGLTLITVHRIQLGPSKTLLVAPRIGSRSQQWSIPCVVRYQIKMTVSQ